MESGLDAVDYGGRAAVGSRAVGVADESVFGIRWVAVSCVLGVRYAGEAGEKGQSLYFMIDCLDEEDPSTNATLFRAA